MSKNGIVILIVSAIVFSAVGFFLGQSTEALFNTPGSKNDPLVSQSYVEKLVGERTSSIQTQLEEMQSQLVALTGGTKIAGNNNPNSGTGNQSNNPPADSGKKVEITASAVNVRSQPNTDADKVGSANKGDKLTYVSTEDDWYKVKMDNGAEGYVASWLSKLQ